MPSSSTGGTAHEHHLRKMFMEAYGRLYYLNFWRQAEFIADVFGELLEYNAESMHEMFEGDSASRSVIKSKVAECKAHDNVYLVGHELGDAATFLLKMGRNDDAEVLADYSLKVDSWARGLAED